MIVAAPPLLDQSVIARSPAGVRHPLDPSRHVKAVLFDVDGTLYRQAPLRLAMALELMTLALTAPLAAPGRWRTLAAYRRAQEHLRVHGNGSATRREQIAAAAVAVGLPLAEVEALVEHWMIERPLKYLRFLRAAGLVKLLDCLERHGVRSGVLTDYPAHRKLEALGLQGRFSLVLCATDPQVGRFKPHPRGFLLACERWQLDPGDVLMVGDRVDVDAAGAAAAGMASVIVARRPPRGRVPANCLLVSSFERLCDVLDRRP